MPDIPQIVGNLVGGLLGLLGDAASTAVGAVMSWLGTAVEAVAQLAMRVVQLLPDATDLGFTIPTGWLHGYSMLNTFLPLSEALAIVLVFTAVAVAGTAFRIAVTVYHLIPKPLMGT